MNWWQNSFVGALVSSIVVNLPLNALTVRLIPEKPQQGDTISVIIETEVDSPQLTVTRGDQLEEIHVQEGDMVEAGKLIATVGNTGVSTDPHLHWGLYVNGVSVDPVPWRYEGFE